MSDTVELVVDAKAQLGEGAIWDSRKQLLYWVDIMGNTVHVYDPATNKDRAIDVGQHVGTIVPRKSGGAIVALHHGIAAMNLDSGKLELLADPENHLPRSRFNDGKCDPGGRFWAGTLSMEGKKNNSALYRMDADKSVHRMLGEITCSNGIVWSLDSKTMYYIDTPTMEVWAFDYDNSTGAIANKRAAVKVEKEHGFPDGMAIDANGQLWIAHWGGSAVRQWDAQSGKLLRSIAVPAERVTSVAFGGKNLDVMYITSASAGMKEEEWKKTPHAGGLFRIDAGVKGVPAFEFAG